MTKNITFKSKNRGFTLIELLVVIVIIAIISTLVIVNVNSSRVKSRDARRKADLLTLSFALEQYYTENRQFPMQAGIISSDNPGELYDKLLNRGYVSSIPTDPLGQVPYYYKSNGNTGIAPDWNEGATQATQYVIFAKLEKDNDSDATALKFLPITNDSQVTYPITTLAGDTYTFNYWVSSK